MLSRSAPMRFIMTPTRTMLNSAVAGAATITTPSSGHTCGIHSMEQFNNKPMKSHERSKHTYEVSAKGEDVGARNEAAFIAYNEVQPTDVLSKYAMPHMVNLLTITPIYMFLLLGGCCVWGVFLWGLYAGKHYVVVTIERPDPVSEKQK
eukprot:Tbor_TRINITY_DN6020_c0_g2::TRINITY_DN6020_c0_g2_i1::g.10296::m.10296